MDTDFCSFRDEVIEYVKKVYGESAVANIITFGTLAARASIRNVGRVTGKSLDICDKVAKMIPARPGISIKEALEENLDLKREYENNKNIKELIDDALLIEGLIVQTGVHAAGVIIADRDLSDYVPLSYNEDDDIWITQFDKDICEKECNLLKMDFLGLENLTIMRRTMDDIKKNHGVQITLDKIPLDDPVILKEIFCKGKTKAVFQFESSGMVQLLKNFQPKNIEHLILLNAMYRPGPLQYIPEIIAIKNGTKKPKYICSQMETITGITFTKPIYQEQIMRIFNEVAGFSLGTADIIRRAMAKKVVEELELYMPSFKEGLIKAGATMDEAEKFCEELMEFSKYAFNKSHSAAYAILAYYTAWFKYYYPVEYMANVLTSSPTKKLPIYIKECKDMGIPVLPPSVNESGEYFTPTKNKHIRFGLLGVKNVATAGADIIKERETNGNYKNLKDFIERLSPIGSRAVYKQVMESLIMTGAFDEFTLNRRQMSEGCEGYVKALKDYLKKKANPKTRPATLEKALAKIESGNFNTSLPEFDRQYVLRQEKELIGFYASGHPLDDYQEIIKENADVLIGEIDADNNGQHITIVGQISEFMPLTRKSDGAPMGKFALEDTTGEINCIAFTEAFAKSGENIKEGSVVILKGKVMAEVDPEDPEIVDLQISVSEVKPITTNKKLYVKLKNLNEWNNVKSLLLKYSGGDPVYVYLEEEKKVLKTKLGVNASKTLIEEYSKQFGEKQIAVC